MGIELGIPSELVWRQPFPGPGLAVRIMGEITEEKVKLLQDADAIFREEVAKAGLERSVNQYFRRAYRQPQRRRHGRRPHLWCYRGPARRDHH